MPKAVFASVERVKSSDTDANADLFMFFFSLFPASRYDFFFFFSFFSFIFDEEMEEIGERGRLTTLRCCTRALANGSVTLRDWMPTLDEDLCESQSGVL